MLSPTVHSTDESATEMILKSQESYANMCGYLDMSMPRDAFITALCKASLPPHYTLTILNSHQNSATVAGANRGGWHNISTFFIWICLAWQMFVTIWRPATLIRFPFLSLWHIIIVIFLLGNLLHKVIFFICLFGMWQLMGLKTRNGNNGV